MYAALMRLVVRHVDAELAHRLGMSLLQLVGRATPLRLLVARVCAPPRACATRALGLELRSPLGVAAGLDKNAHAVLGLAALGFGFVEVGTVTARPQPGNPRPRLVRLPADRAIVNRMGFNNDGAAVVADRLRRLRSTRAGQAVVLGVNVGRSKAAGPDETIDDYRTSTRLLAPYADYLTVNISSPNTPGLRDLHAADRLRPLLEAVRDECDAATTRRTPLPVLLKISPDLDDADVPAVVAVARAAGLAGVIATNTTVGRAGLTSPHREVERAGGGGLSGRPLRERARHVQSMLRARPDAGVVVASGGVDSPDDAATRLAEGAELVQAYTGFVYGGPTWPARVNRRLARR
ncbi:quinone-dependent dihydroorotate dehydrogenase [Jatrophihabitans endophyticus]|uniref:quinone-dependent dihydroorotate dehydrogenase n=1 Tax=Jatrophihabitans endophyticus TaxID=1206085 RepID=UPI001A10655E|nr:quinone-dependent dihydroorotate dehydrogenase [Jatrophihabitans endophyticus]MBE7186660.1 quinone-dependent dihydroorotate dehydrogenase [Jatrophihabitans endophyticus]